MQRFYVEVSDLPVGVKKMEWCFNVKNIGSPFNDDEIAILMLILTEGFVREKISTTSWCGEENVVELGPRMNFATAWSSNMVSICKSCGLHNVTRVERSRRYVLLPDTDRAAFVRTHHDRMTEMEYLEPLTTFDSGLVPEKVYTVPLMEKGPDALLDIPGISMDAFDRQLYYDYFVLVCGRNPTIVELMDLNNANSEHSRHGFFKGKMVIDGVEMPETLMQIVQSTLAVYARGSLLAFCDNSSVIEGCEVQTIMPENPGRSSIFRLCQPTYHPLLTAETHNFPTGVAPFPGAETGTGGRIRDVQATGRSGLVIAGTAGYCFGNLQIPGYELPWEDRTFAYPGTLATAREICIGASNGASDYGNKFGEPVIQGFARSFGLYVSGVRWEFVKPIMFTGGIGQIEQSHVKKREAIKGMKIVQIGGPAYRIGFCGGAASSMLQGENNTELDFNAVQRGDAEMAQKANRVIRACSEMWLRNPIVSIHDQGAGGPANVLKELVEKAGGHVELRKINCGDPTLSTLEIWVCEYQERNGLLICEDDLEKFMRICVREKVPCEVLGEVTGDGKFVVHDAEMDMQGGTHDDVVPVDLDLAALLGNMPQKTFADQRVARVNAPVILPAQLTMEEALWRVLRLISVGSKRFLVNKVDRAVTGLIARQQCCGPLQLPVSDVAVVAQSHFGLTGIATAIGEQPIKMLVDPAKGARMAVTESLTNLVWARINDLEQVKCSANWMWAPKLPGEGAALYDAACAMRDFMIKIGVAVDGGKDSLSMATRIGEEIVKSPRELVISAYATMSDITKVVTPDLKDPGNSRIIFIDLSGGKKRLGGSALAQVYGQIGDDSPDMSDPDLLKRAFLAVQKLIDQDLILAGHDVSDGGLIVTLLEMAFAGNCGFRASEATHSAMDWFAEEAGLVIECKFGTEDDQGTMHDPVRKILDEFDVPCEEIGLTLLKKTVLVEDCAKRALLHMDMQELRGWWEETSYQLERLQTNPLCADQEKRNIYDRKGPKYQVPFEPQLTPMHVMTAKNKPRVAILREEGSNGDREMTSAFYSAGFEVQDVTMTDLLYGLVSLDTFRGLVAVGGFSYADVPESAKGWAATIRCNERLNRMFTAFYERPDTFTLGVCNGCQLFALLGWVPWRGLSDERQPRFVCNVSGRFESRWSTVRIQKSPAMMLQGMEGMTFGAWVDHGEGRVHFPDSTIMDQILLDDLAPIVFVDDEGSSDGEVSHSYPFNPNGSPYGITGLCSPDGRHLAMMPHPERTFLTWQAPWMPYHMKSAFTVSPWLKMFQNARAWCENTKSYNF